MNDITKKREFGKILQDAANYNTLKDLIRALDKSSLGLLDTDSVGRTVIGSVRCNDRRSK
jgi:hypothetical protein